jgi:histidinol-phosphatase
VTTYDDDLRLALVLADAVDRLTLERFRAADLVVESKPDLTPVTDADRAAEELIRAQLKRSRPRDAVEGEEFERTGHGPRRWIIDPIDGTKNFVRGVPVWATLIALVDEGKPVVGVVSAPALQRRWWAASGSGAWTGRSLTSARRISVSGVTRLADASLSYSSLSGWRDLGRRDAFLELMDACWRTRAYGDFWSYMLVAEGAVDAAAEPELAVHDMAALVPIVEEAGGSFTGLDGRLGCWSGNAVATNGHLHLQLLRRLAVADEAEASLTTVRPADLADVDRVAQVAAATFGLACPPTISPQRVSAFITEVLSPERFADYIGDDDRVVLIAEDDGRAVGYAMFVAGEPGDDDVRAVVHHRPTVELSKLYVLPSSHGAGASGQLLEAGREWAKERGATTIWLGVNQQNARAQKFYGKNGFRIVGTKRFNVGGAHEEDFVMELPL